MPNWVLLLVSSLREKVTNNSRYRDSPVMNARLFTAYHSIFLIAACSYHFLAPEGSTTLPGLMSRALSPYQLHPIMAPLNARYCDSPVMNARLFTAYHSIFLTAIRSYHFLAPE